MLVQRVVMSSSPLESWTVLGEDAAPVEPIERYLAYLTDIERSPNTVKAYAHDLKDWFSFLGVRGLDWRDVRLEVSLFRFDGHHWCGGQAASAVSYSAGLR
ncbi:site-specific integrase [Streptomyces sp. NPDC054765]